MVDIGALGNCDMISEQLQRDGKYNRRENVGAVGYMDYLTALFTLIAYALISENIELATTRTNSL